jgi:5-keto 4-deoxyuronate isomerase
MIKRHRRPFFGKIRHVIRCAKRRITINSDTEALRKEEQRDKIVKKNDNKIIITHLQILNIIVLMPIRMKLNLINSRKRKTRVDEIIQMPLFKVCNTCRPQDTLD